MALQKTLSISRFGTPIEIKDLYICVTDVQVRQIRDVIRGEDGQPITDADGNPSKINVWKLFAQALLFSSRESKYAGLEPIDVLPVSMNYDTETSDNLPAYVYKVLQSHPMFEGAVAV